MSQEFEEVDLIIEDDDDSDETMVSITDLVDDERSYEDHDEGEFDTQGGSYNKDQNADKLKLVAFSYSDYLRAYKKGDLSDAQLDIKLGASIEALFDLVLDFGNVDALDGLISLLSDLVFFEDTTLFDKVMTELLSFIDLEKLPLLSEDFATDSSTQVTLELQEHLLSNIFEMQDLPESANEAFLEAFSANPNFSSDTRLNSF